MNEEFLTLGEEDAKHLRAASGWLGLRNVKEALAELEQISSAGKMQPEILELRWSVYSKIGKWEICAEIAALLLEAAPYRPFAWLQRAHALRCLPEKGAQAAFEALFPALRNFPEEYIIPFNLACYASQLGRFDDANKYLSVALKLAIAQGEGEYFTKVAQKEPDLEPLWERVDRQKFFREGMVIKEWKGLR